MNCCFCTKFPLLKISQVGYFLQLPNSPEFPAEICLCKAGETTRFASQKHTWYDNCRRRRRHCLCSKTNHVEQFCFTWQVTLHRMTKLFVVWSNLSAHILVGRGHGKGVLQNIWKELIMHRLCIVFNSGSPSIKSTLQQHHHHITWWTLIEQSPIIWSKEAVRNAGWKLNSASIYLKPPLHVDEVARKINGLSNLLILALKL